MTMESIVFIAEVIFIGACARHLWRAETGEREARKQRALDFGSTRWARGRFRGVEFDDERGGADALTRGER